MLKKLSIFLILIISLFLAMSAGSASSMPEIYINNVRQLDSGSYAMYANSVYILPEKAQEIFNLKLSTDENKIVYTFSTPTRSVTYDSKSGTISISDRYSFAYKVMENACLSYKSGTRDFVPLRLLCEAIGLEVDYDYNTHSVNIICPEYQPGFYNQAGVAVASKSGKYGLVNSK